VPAREGDQASGAMPVSLVCCGLVGTMVADGGMVDRAYAEAIATQGVVTGTTAYARCMAQVHQHRGEPAADVLQAMFPESQARGQAAYLALDRSFCDAVGRMGLTPVPGAAAALAKLTDAGIRVCLITGFSRRVLTLVLDTLGWVDRVDLALCPEDVPRGSPWPDPVLSAMLKLGVSDVREAAVAHDTESGLLSGRRAGAGVAAGVLTGPHSADRLRRAGATHLIPSVAQLMPLRLRPIRPPRPGCRRRQVRRRLQPSYSSGHPGPGRPAARVLRDLATPRTVSSTDNAETAEQCGGCRMAVPRVPDGRAAGANNWVRNWVISLYAACNRFPVRRRAVLHLG
jgi:phosphonatase-like hydrolase